MDPIEFRACLFAIGWSPSQLAQGLGYGRDQGHRWASGRLPIPEAVADWLRSTAAYHVAHPLPHARRQPGFGRDSCNS